MQRYAGFCSKEKEIRILIENLPEDPYEDLEILVSNEIPADIFLRFLSEKCGLDVSSGVWCEFPCIHLAGGFPLRWYGIVDGSRILRKKPRTESYSTGQ